MCVFAISPHASTLHHTARIAVCSTSSYQCAQVPGPKDVACRAVGHNIAMVLAVKGSSLHPACAGAGWVRSQCVLQGGSGRPGIRCQSRAVLQDVGSWWVGVGSGGCPGSGFPEGVVPTPWFEGSGIQCPGKGYRDREPPPLESQAQPEQRECQSVLKLQSVS